MIGKRVLAILLDTVGFVIAYGLLVEIVSAISTTLGVLVGGAGPIVFLAYFAYFEAEYGQTVGKMALGLVVVTEDGDPLDYRAAGIRTLLRLVDALPSFYLVGLVVVLLTDRKQRVGDIVANTVVVKAESGIERL